MEKERIQEDSILKAYDNAQSMIVLADSKANLSITIQSLLITIGLGSSLLANLFSRIWQFNKIWFWVYSCIIIIFVLTTMTGVIFSILVYKARFPEDEAERKRDGFLYHEHVASYKNSKIYYDDLVNKSKEEILKDYASQTYFVAKIATRKMKYVNCSILFLLVNIFLVIILLVISSILLVIM